MDLLNSIPWQYVIDGALVIGLTYLGAGNLAKKILINRIISAVEEADDEKTKEKVGEATKNKIKNKHKNP